MHWHGPHGVAALRFRPATTDSRHGLPVAPDLLEQGFHAVRPNQVWLADITYIPTGEGWPYLGRGARSDDAQGVGPSAICRSPSPRVSDRARCARWAMRDHLRAELASTAWLMAAQSPWVAPSVSTPPAPTARCSRPGACGSPWTATAAATTTRPPPGPADPGSCRNGLIAWRSMESFFHTFKVELVHRQRFATRELFAHLEGYYNHQRLHSAPGYRTPEQVEQRAA